MKKIVVLMGLVMSGLWMVSTTIQAGHLESITAHQITYWELKAKYVNKFAYPQDFSCYEMRAGSWAPVFLTAVTPFPCRAMYEKERSIHRVATIKCVWNSMTRALTRCCHQPYWDGPCLPY